MHITFSCSKRAVFCHLSLMLIVSKLPETKAHIKIKKPLSVSLSSQCDSIGMLLNIWQHVWSCCCCCCSGPCGGKYVSAGEPHSAVEPFISKKVIFMSAVTKHFRLGSCLNAVREMRPQSECILQLTVFTKQELA